MRTRTLFTIILCLGIAGAAQAQDPYVKLSQDGTPVPDVNKPNFNDPTDQSCWMAAAANMLGGADYGTGATAAAKAQSIYSTLRNDLGYTNPGSTEYAINYWLYAYGKNPDSSEFKPNHAYNDVTVMEGRFLNVNDYLFLQNELVSCQYIEISFDNPAHAMTFVGFSQGQNTSIWHDSDFNTTAPGDDTYFNGFDAAGNWDLHYLPPPAPPASPVALDNADGYVLLCPGLNKPEDAMRNYDVAWFLTDNEQTQAGTPRDNSWTAEFRVAGAKKNDFDDPFWLDASHERYNQEMAIVHIDNEPAEEMHKEISLLVDYRQRNQNIAAENIMLQIPDPGDGVGGGVSAMFPPDSVQWNAHNGQALFTWILDYQPAWEEIVFPDNWYWTLEGKVKDWDVATICIPEPTTLALLGCGFLAILRRRRA